MSNSLSHHQCKLVHILKSSVGAKVAEVRWWWKWTCFHIYWTCYFAC